MVVLPVWLEVVEHLETGVLSGLSGLGCKEVSGTMGEEKVKKDRYLYCRFCGAYCEGGEELVHRGRCKRSFIQEIDHIPVKRRWCMICDAEWVAVGGVTRCLVCGGDATGIRWI